MYNIVFLYFFVANKTIVENSIKHTELVREYPLRNRIKHNIISDNTVNTDIVEPLSDFPNSKSGSSAVPYKKAKFGAIETLGKCNANFLSSKSLI